MSPFQQERSFDNMANDRSFTTQLIQTASFAAVPIRAIEHFPDSLESIRRAHRTVSELNASRGAESDKRFSLVKTLIRLESAGVFHDSLVGIVQDRQAGQLRGLRTATIIAAAEHWVDECTGDRDSKIGIINELLGLIEGSREYKAEPGQLGKVHKYCHHLHRQVSGSPGEKIFYDEFEKLADAARRQINGEGSIELASELGGRCLTTIVHSIACPRPARAVKFMESAYHLGAYLQLLDDISDLKTDQRNGIKTSVNNGQPPTEAIRSAYAAAIEHRRLCFEKISPELFGVLRWLEIVGSIWWRPPRL